MLRLQLNSSVYVQQNDTISKLKNFASFRETCQWLKFPLNGVRDQSRVSPTVGLLRLLYGSETWSIKARDARRITAAEMKYMRRTAGYTWTG